MKTNKEIVDLLVTAILKKCKGLNKYDCRGIKAEIECTIDDINYYMFVEVWSSCGINCNVICDLWDINGHQIITKKHNISNEVEKQIIKHYEQ